MPYHLHQQCCNGTNVYFMWRSYNDRDVGFEFVGINYGSAYDWDVVRWVISISQKGKRARIIVSLISVSEKFPSTTRSNQGKWNQRV